jgi:NAD(P)-dependent dehydrogenase (short-subunit alcohol dehydrogenase family)
MGELDGKTALVTGSSAGIGAATAVVMARHGADVVVNYRKSIHLAEEVVEHIRATGQRGLAIQADATDREQVRRMVDTIIDQWGELNILVNNVGYLYKYRIEMLEPEEWYRSVDENLTSQVFCAQAVLPGMLERGRGRIVNISSIAGQRGSPSGYLCYSTCKAGVVALTKTLARRYATQGITVNCVAPGVIDAGMIRNRTSEWRAQMAADIPMDRLGSAEEVGEAVAFLASERASYVTGQTIAVNGGLYM